MKWRRFLTICIFVTLITGCNATKNASQSECYLCGSGRPDVWDYYEEEGGLVLLCLNSWTIGEITLENDRDESEEYSTMSDDTNGEDRCRWITRSEPAQQKCHIEIYYGKKSVLDLKALKKRLCRECYDKVLKAALESGTGIKQYCSVLMDMESGELYPISSSTEYFIRDYQVRIEHKKEKKEADVQIEIFTNRR